MSEPEWDGSDTDAGRRQKRESKDASLETQKKMLDEFAKTGLELRSLDAVFRQDLKRMKEGGTGPARSSVIGIVPWYASPIRFSLVVEPEAGDGVPIRIGAPADPAAPASPTADEIGAILKERLTETLGELRNEFERVRTEVREAALPVVLGDETQPAPAGPTADEVGAILKQHLTEALADLRGEFERGITEVRDASRSARPIPSADQIATDVTARLKPHLTEIRSAVAQSADAKPDAPEGGVSALVTERLEKFEKVLADNTAKVAKVADLPPAPTVGQIAAGVLARQTKAEQAEAKDEKAKAEEDAPGDPQGYFAAGAAAICVVLLAGVLLWLVTRPTPTADADPPATPAELADQVAAKVAKLPRGSSTAVLAEADAKLISALATNFAEFKTNGGKLAPPAPKLELAPKVETPPTAVTLTDADRDKLIKGIKAAAQPKTDVLIVVGHGATMSATDYQGAFVSVLTKVPRGGGYPTRVGLAVAEGTALNVVVPLDALKYDPPKLEAPARERTEELAAVSGAAEKALPPAGGKRRAILVVSTQARPVRPPVEGWSNLTDVHVVVVARQAVGPTDRENLVGWLEFAEATRGTVQLISDWNDRGTQNAALETCLNRLIALP